MRCQPVQANDGLAVADISAQRHLHHLLQRQGQHLQKLSFIQLALTGSQVLSQVIADLLVGITNAG
jgi:hypothetical protein